MGCSSFSSTVSTSSNINRITDDNINNINIEKCRIPILDGDKYSDLIIYSLDLKNELNNCNMKVELLQDLINKRKMKHGF